MRRLIYILTIILAALTVAACDGNVYYDQAVSIDEQGWLPTDAATFRVDVDDTVHSFDVLVEVRNATTYPYANLFLLVDTRFPDGSIASDTLECPLADPTGRWYGKRTGRYVDARFRLRNGAIRFPQQGSYSFSIANGMRDSAIVGIKDIALRIQKVKGER